jgi:hypothetical protein
MTTARKALGGAATAVVVAAALAGCGGGSSSYYSLCVNPITQFRMPDVYCLLGNPLYHPGWSYYVPSSYRAPAVSQHVTSYNVHNYTAPKGKVQTATAPTSGGKIAKPAATSKPKVNMTKAPAGSTSKPKSNTGTGSKPKTSSGFKSSGGKK